MKLLKIILGLVVATQSAFAMNISSQGDRVIIRDAISPSGVKPVVHLISRGADGREQRTPLERAEGVRVETKDNDMLIDNASAGGRYHSMQVDRSDGGNRQSIRVSVGSGDGRNQALSQSWSSSAGPRQFVPPPPFPKVVPPFRPSMSAAGGPNRPRIVNKRIFNQDFSNRRMAGSNIVNSKFELVNLERAVFVGSRLVNSQFVECSLTDAEFSGSQLVNVKFERADLRGANFRDARITNLNLTDSDLSGATWVDGRVCAAGSIGRCL